MRIKQLEKKHGKPLREILIEAFNRHGSQSAVAESLGVSQPTISLWLIRVNLKQQTVLRPMNQQQEQHAS